MNMRNFFRTAATLTTVLTVVTLFFRLAPEHVRDGVGSTIPLGIEYFVRNFFYIAFYLGFCLALFKMFVFFVTSKPQKRLDIHGLPEYITPMTRLNAKISQHIEIVMALHNGVEPDGTRRGMRPSAVRALKCLIFPWADPRYRYAASLINIDKIFPFQQAIVAPKVNPYNQVVTTGYTRQLEDYFETVGKDLGFELEIHDPGSMPSVAPDSVLGKVLGVLSRIAQLKAVRIAFWVIVALVMTVVIALLADPPFTYIFCIPLGLLVGIIIRIETVTDSTDEVDDVEDEQWREVFRRISLSRSNIIIKPGQRQWHALAAQILAITDYIHIHGLSREEALDRIERVLRSNIFQIEGTNATPEMAYEWARAELYDFSAVSIDHPNGYQESDVKQVRA